MSKPSIFSKEYQRKMKRRKLTISIVIISILVVGVIFFVVKPNNLGNIKNSVAKIWSKDNSKTKDVEKKPKEIEKKDEESKEAVKKEKEEPKEKYYEIKMSSGNNVKITYSEEAGVKKILTIDNSSDYSSYDINKSQSNLVLVDSKNQDLLVVNSNGEVKNIVKKGYESKSYGKTYSKEEMLKSYPNLIWTAEAKFINDNTIAYISNLPYFGNQQDLDKYLWICDIEGQSHRTIFEAKGKDVKLNKTSVDVLEVSVDGNIKQVNVDGTLTAKQ
ncbi:hypothetical protein SAMN02745163_00865 [Clostridium cavendishii DSM 21758]|uniref:Uncharacterized protein n=1 Tax=Clostridium cavendishii DSM 21758 TaxID=1121302 RepID=A0A1M6EJ68_9CLOT|nr:hypothetical protein [Clostridium cavendishii]SHI85459.1 hypothetical protein SAMN02745163_00865 [Clostridium cavendishii DSM 21758]